MLKMQLLYVKPCGAHKLCICKVCSCLQQYIRKILVCLALTDLDIFHMASINRDRRAARRPLPPPQLSLPLSLSLSLGSASGRRCVCVRALTPHGVLAHRRPKNVAKDLFVSNRPDSLLTCLRSHQHYTLRPARLCHQPPVTNGCKVTHEPFPLTTKSVE